MRQVQQEDATDGHPIFAATYDYFNRYAEKNLLPEHRQYLARDLQGTVLDIGAGIGAMFPYFKQATQQTPSLQLHGIEPDPHMRTRAETEAKRLGLPIELRRARAESLAYADDTFDVVIASLVFCTIPNTERALDEIDRVLKPTGEFRFLEHVCSAGLLGQVQGLAAPLWKVIGAGCHLNRQTKTVFANSPLEILEIDTLDIGVAPVKRFIRGRAVPERSTESS